ncbi:PREDICTED: meteorin [Ficedula albicollis]|uniref:meteorin n=1 Tax=Ficedula albicollis TaxID=59894 RepID=UPI000359C4F1|nr:PREDICTED: meteorin [Ficedula albicollis]
MVGGTSSPRQGPKHRPKAPDSEQRAGARQEGLPHAGDMGGQGGHAASSVLSGTKQPPDCPPPPRLPSRRVPPPEPRERGAVPHSGLSQEAGSVEQLSLHCAEGSLEWLYPTGALRLRLAPRLPPTTHWLARPALPAASPSAEGACRPCNDTEILMAICTSDFVIRGSIRSVSNDAELQESIIGVSATRIHRQKFPLFRAGGDRKSGGLQPFVPF